MSDNRHIRVFVSSTFRDMQEERDFLVKFIFPQLRKLCESRGITWGEVDLRWGVNDEDKAEGKVLPICLAEIQRCQPYFIGLLGERYGWIPAEIPEELSDREPWLKEHSKHSVTELEILHGVLRNPSMANHAFFYFRDPAYIQKVPSERRHEYLSESAESAEKLRRLKQLIRANGFPLRDNYPNPEALGELVLKDFKELIDTLYPESERFDPFDREALEHESFAASRRGVYIGRQEYFDRLDAHVDGAGQPLVILGDSGSGKSALLANWVLHFRERHPDQFVIAHYIGSTIYSTDWAAMMRRIMGEFKRHLHLQLEVPDNPVELGRSFANWLHMAAAKSKVVLVIDALNQLEDREGALDLVWLPPSIPPNIRLIVSTLPGPSLNELQERKWNAMQIVRLSDSERREFIRKYLCQYAKELSPAQAERIARTEQSANPLYVKVLLEELRVYGDHDTLSRRIEHYIAASTIPDLYKKVLARWESDYEGDSDLVGDALSLLWASRRGLSEAEIVEMLGTDGEPLPKAVWAPFYLAAEQSLVSRSGLLNFAHDYLRDAVKEAYMPTAKHQKQAHVRVAVYFSRKENNSRRLEELPWQMAKAEAWKPLYDLLSKLEFVDSLWRVSEFDARAYWTSVLGNTELRIVDAYREVLENPLNHLEHAMVVSSVLEAFGFTELTRFLIEHVAVAARFSGSENIFAHVLGKKAGLLLNHGDMGGALSLFQEQEHLCSKLGDSRGKAMSLGGQAQIYKAQGNLDKAMALLKESECIFRECEDAKSLGTCIGNQANILVSSDDLDGAMVLYEEAERISHEIGDRDQLQRVIGNRGVLCLKRGETDRALELLKEQERLCREIHHLDGLQASLLNQAAVVRHRGDRALSLSLLKSQEDICRKSQNLGGLVVSLAAQAREFVEMDDVDAASDLVEESVKICNAHGLVQALIDITVLVDYVRKRQSEKHGTAPQDDTTTLMGSARKAFESRQWDEAHRQLDSLLHKGMPRELIMPPIAECLLEKGLDLCRKSTMRPALEGFQKAEAIFREFKIEGSIRRVLGGRAAAMAGLGEKKAALKLFKRQEYLCYEARDSEELTMCLLNQSKLLIELGKYRQAYNAASNGSGLCLTPELERIKEELDQARQLAQSHLPGHAPPESSDDQTRLQRLATQTEHAFNVGRFEDAENLLDELLSEGISWKQLGPGFVRCLLKQGERHLSIGELEKALVPIGEAEEVSRECGDLRGLCFSSLMQAVAFDSLDKGEEALAKYKDVENLCRDTGDKACLAQSLVGQAEQLKSQQNVNVAIIKLVEAEHIYKALGNKRGIQDSLGKRAAIFFQLQEFDKAMLTLTEHAAICRELGDKIWLQRSISDQARILHMRGDYDNAMALYHEEETLCTELDNKDGLERSLGNQAGIRFERGDTKGAMILYRRQQDLCEELGNLPSLVRCLGNQSAVLATTGDRERAFSLADKACRVARHNNLFDLAKGVEDQLKMANGG